MPTSLSTSQITANSATINWQGVSGANYYVLNYRMSSASVWTTVNNISGTSYTMTNLANCTSYIYYLQAYCSGNAGAYSNAISFSTTGCFQNYCTSRGTNTSREYINRVALGSINNTSGDNGGYRDYTNLSTALTDGSSYTITLSPGFHGSSTREYWTVYIDYNHNGSFSDAGERIVKLNSSSTITTAFVVPAGALNGLTKMRVQMKRSSSVKNACTTFTSGEVEDYAINISGSAHMNAPTEMENANTAFDQEALIKVYPNPAADKINLEFESVSGNNSIAVYNIEGKMMISEQKYLSEGMNTIELNTTDLPNGIYFISVENNGVINKIKFLISR